MAYRFDINAFAYDGTAACVVADGSVLADLTSAISGWGTTNPNWGLATRDGGDPSLFRFTRLVFNQSPSVGMVIQNTGPTGGQPLSESVSWTVTTLTAAAPEVGDYVMIAGPGANAWRLARVMSVPA